MKLTGLYIMAALYIFTGTMHFLRPKGFMQIMPKFVPWHYQLVLVSGICEIAFALLLLFPATRPIGAWLIIILLVAVFPANIQMAITFYQKQNPYLWLAILRLPLQFVLIWWAWLYTGK
ncbi:MauE/DoxX family redox-associated membrane protein [Dyadobacter sp. CY347]|uniref:DoxX family protein n=1 Tax=Dyadobacter sp. CY347 TaxID=2909336 RepID=UPI001F38F977|nr:MauE/DoxX family redox-associated membrane protein [Dyadobacter sp. CY347]MCF2487878.1 DoxX family protein [Dyadobacter sp. CY347]